MWTRQEIKRINAHVASCSVSDISPKQRNFKKRKESPSWRTEQWDNGETCANFVNASEITFLKKDNELRRDKRINIPE